VNAEDDNPYGTGLGLQIYWAVFFKRKGIVSWNKLNDRFGAPTPWGKHPRNAGPKEKATLFAALKACRTTAW
jgi:phage gp29-like protein